MFTSSRNFHLHSVPCFFSCLQSLPLPNAIGSGPVHSLPRDLQKIPLPLLTWAWAQQPARDARSPVVPFNKLGALEAPPSNGLWLPESFGKQLILPQKLLHSLGRKSKSKGKLFIQLHAIRDIPLCFSHYFWAHWKEHGSVVTPSPDGRPDSATKWGSLCKAARLPIYKIEPIMYRKVYKICLWENIHLALRSLFPIPSSNKNWKNGWFQNQSNKYTG